jgi:2,4-dienoyl-CoA reductase-like NADH-dependent reductase (Old Yellow Enzyme family)/thioredoxin reductase
MTAPTTGPRPYPHLFQPLRLGPVEVRNRLYMTAHGLGYARPDPDNPGFGLPSDRHAAYYAERARGGIALIVQEATVADPSGQGSAFGATVATVAAAFAPGCVPHFAKLADAVHAHGARIFLQLYHGGHHADPRWEPGGPRRPLLSASDVPAVESYSIPRAMNPAEIRSVIGGFAASARNMRDAGYDGVEIQGAHSALVEQFLSPFYNKRTDSYGGSAANRLRFALELLDAVREAAGPGLAVGMRLNTDELLPGGLSADDLAEIAARLDESGLVDFLDLDIGTMHTAPLMIAGSYVPPLPAEDFIAAIRPAIRRAAVLGCPGRMTDPAEADRLVREGAMDMVGAARAHIAEPAFTRLAEAGRIAEARICIACNHCLEGVVGGVGCVINPATGRERAWGEASFARPAAAPGRRVVVVGGGPAGLEAARVAAMLGHRVTLIEREPALGGALRLMAALPGREATAAAAEWYERRLAELQVEIRRGTEATAETVLAERPDAVILATGARFEPTGSTGFIAEPIPGWDRPIVATPEAVLRDGRRARRRAVILDEEGQATAAGVAELLAAEGAAVELATRWQMVVHRLQAGGLFAWALARLYAAGVTLSPNTYIKAIGENRVTLYNIFSNEERVVEDVDLVVLVGSRRPQAGGLADALAGGVERLVVIGDAATPRTLAEAGYEGQRAAREA